MFYYKPKNLKKFLPSVITLGIYITMLLPLVFIGMFNGGDFSYLRYFIVLGAVIVATILIDNEVVHKVCLGVLAFYIFVGNPGYNIFTIKATFDYLNWGFGVGEIFLDLHSLATIALFVFVALRLILKKTSFDKVIVFLLLGMAALLLMASLFELIGDIIDEAVTYGAYHCLLPIPILAFFFFSLDEVGIENFFFSKKTTKEEPKQVEEKPVEEKAEEKPAEEAK